MYIVESWAIKVTILAVEALSMLSGNRNFIIYDVYHWIYQKRQSDNGRQYRVN